MKYGPKTKTGLRKIQIMKVVDAFMRDHPIQAMKDSSMNVTDLIGPLSQRLEIISEQDIIITKESKDKNNSPSLKDDSTLDRSLDTSKTIAKDQKQEKSTGHMNITSPWMLIDAFKIAESEHLRQLEAIKATQKKKEMARALDEQILSNLNRVKKVKEENDQYPMMQKEKLKIWEAEQKLALMNGKEKMEALKFDRLSQIREKEMKRRKEKEDRKISELRGIEEMKAVLERERQTQLEAKLAEKEKWELIKEENKKNIALAKLKKEEEALLDATLVEESKRQADEQEAERAKELRERLSKLEENGKKLDEAGAFKKPDDVLRFERALLKAQEERERKIDEEERKKNKRMIEKTREILETNTEIIKEKHLKIFMEKEEKHLIADRLSQEANALIREQELNFETQKEKKKEYRNILKSQMNEKQQESEKMNQEMTVNEMSLNKTLLEEAKAWLEGKNKI